MSEHYLRFLANEDEAQMTGYNFVINGDRAVVTETFHHPEYEVPPQLMSRKEARQLWKRLIASGEFEAQPQPQVNDLPTVLKKAKTNYGFLTLQDVKIISQADRLRQILVRCGNGRFLTAAQDVEHFISIIQRDGKDYVRDLSLPAK